MRQNSLLEQEAGPLKAGSLKAGKLVIVPTPLGNRQDISLRALASGLKSKEIRQQLVDEMGVSRNLAYMLALWASQQDSSDALE